MVPANMPIVAGVWLVCMVAFTSGFFATHCLASTTLSKEATLYGVPTAYRSRPTSPLWYTTCTLLSCKAADPLMKLVLSIKISATPVVTNCDAESGFTTNKCPSLNKAKYLSWVPQYINFLTTAGVDAP